MNAPEPDDATGQDLTRMWSVLAHIVTPTTFVAALMMYFGSVRANTTYRSLGVDPSMLGLSFQDYVLRSVGTTVEPLVLVLLVALFALPVHALIVRYVTRHRRTTRCAVAVLAVLGAGGVLAGVMGLAGWVRPPTKAPVIPILLALGVLALGFSTFLHATVHPRGTGRGPFAHRVVSRTIFVALLILLLLWSVASYARIRGEDEANHLRRYPGLLPGAVVYAPRRLYLEGAGITERVYPDSTAMFRYRYTGLRLLIESNRRYFLLPACWATTPEARAIALPDDESFRLEFYVVTTPPVCPPPAPS